jgi:hypothetical protein
MAQDSIVGGLFGMNPEMYQQQQNQQALAQAAQLAQLDPMARARTGIMYGANRLVGALGGQDPQLQKISAIQALGQQFDVTTPEGLMQAAGAIRTQYPDVAFGLSQRAQELGLSRAKTQKETFSLSQETKLRDELSRLPPDATQEQILGVVTRFGSPDRVLAALQASSDRAAQRETQLTIAKDRIDANIQAAKDRNATAKDIAQMTIDGKKEIANLAASLKGPSAAVIKAQERADKIAEGKESLSDTVEVAKTLVSDLAKSGGMTSTSNGPLSNLITSLGTGTVGQVGGRVFGTANQAKRDELNSVRLQLFNSVKEATGMSASQLNSNVELKTWLSSLGGADMTKEANEAILNNISNKFLKGMPKATGMPSSNAPQGTAANPIVLK